MMLTVAENQWIVTPNINSVSLYSPPVQLGDLDRATAILVVHAIYGGAVPTDRQLEYLSELSNDGVNWVTDGISDAVDEVSDTPKMVSGAVNGAWIRFILRFTVSAAAPGGVCFSLRVKLDRT